jgi:hypothetical protein
MSKNYIILKRSLKPSSGRASGMDAFTTRTLTRIEQCKINAKTRSEKKRQAAFEALSALQGEKRPITKAAVARRAGVSVVFLRKHLDLVQAHEEEENTTDSSTSRFIDRRSKRSGHCSLTQEIGRHEAATR